MKIDPERELIISIGCIEATKFVDKESTVMKRIKIEKLTIYLSCGSFTTELCGPLDLSAIADVDSSHEKPLGIQWEIEQSAKLTISPAACDGKVFAIYYI